jgi:hypothetical protein
VEEEPAAAQTSHDGERDKGRPALQPFGHFKQRFCKTLVSSFGTFKY